MITSGLGISDNCENSIPLTSDLILGLWCWRSLWIDWGHDWSSSEEFTSTAMFIGSELIMRKVYSLLISSKINYCARFSHSIIVHWRSEFLSTNRCGGHDCRNEIVSSSISENGSSASQENKNLNFILCSRVMHHDFFAFWMIVVHSRSRVDHNALLKLRR